MAFANFTSQYAVSKTLTFKLIPQGKTAEHLEKNEIIPKDIAINAHLSVMKKIIRQFHAKNFSEKMKTFSFTLEEMLMWEKAFNDNKTDPKSFEKIQKSLCKSVAKHFGSYEKLFKKEVLEQILNFIEEENLEEFYHKEGLTKNAVKESLSKVSSYFGYLDDFNLNLKYIYSSEMKHGTYAFRIICDNLSVFYRNTKAFEIIKESLSQEISTLQKDLELQENLKDFFSLSNYGKFCSQDNITLFNAIRGGKTLEDGTKIKGLNEYINQYNQLQKDKTKKLPIIKKLDSMVLSNNASLSWIQNKFESGTEMLSAIKDFWNTIGVDKDSESLTILGRAKNLFNDLSLGQFDLNGIYIDTKKSIGFLANECFHNWRHIRDCYTILWGKTNPKGNRKTQVKYDKEKEDAFGKEDSLSISFINRCLMPTSSNGESAIKIENYISSFGEERNKGGLIVNEDFITWASTLYSGIEKLMSSENQDILLENEDNIKKIKDFMDNLLKIFQHYKLLSGSGQEINRDNDFYTVFDSIFDTLKNIVKLYDMVRSFVTKKPYSTDKVRLSFGSAITCGGWENELAKYSIILKNGSDSYLGIINPKNPARFDNVKEPKGDCYEKMQYSSIPDPSKLLSTLMVINGVTTRITGRKDENGINAALEEAKEKYLPEDINTIRKKGSYKLGDNFDKEDSIKYIAYYMERLLEYKKTIKFDFKKPSEYHSYAEFLEDVGSQAYKISFKNVSLAVVNAFVENDQLYLFKIYHRDMLPYIEGIPGYYTLFWKELFSEQNLSDTIYKLCGGGQIFYRKASLKVFSHHIEDKGRFLVKDKRYTEDSFLFHVPIEINSKLDKKSNVNLLVKESIRQNDVKHIIGIDRGERHLIYVSVIDLDGNIIESFSLNEILSKSHNSQRITNYQDLLTKRGEHRKEQKKNWNVIQEISSLKKGYLSHVIHVISSLVIKYDAIVVLEDLNSGFMQSRAGIEKQLYRNFEIALIKKLNLLINKTTDVNSDGGLRRPYQLTNKFESFEKIGNQCGVLFYLPAWNTSKLDPVTGFCNLFDCRSKSIVEDKNFFGKFKDIRFNAEKDYFEFVVDNYTAFNHRAEGTQQSWTICTSGIRIKAAKDKNTGIWVSDEVPLTDKLKSLFEKNEIDIYVDLKNQILSQTSGRFFAELMNLFYLTVQIRNSVIGKEIDYLLSPIMGKNGEFFDSRNPTFKYLPENADANGAYNIARKGLIMVNKIKDAKSASDRISNVNNREYLQFVQGQFFMEKRKAA